MIIPRPMPPKFVTDAYYPAFHPAEGLDEFVRLLFLDEYSEFYNEDHAHLIGANIGYLWTNVANVKQMRQVAATAQIPTIQGNRWNKEIFDFQLKSWFGSIDLDFLITIDAKYAHTMEDISFCALVEHELYHCALKGFNRQTGLPTYQMRDHDVTEFIGVTRRYGVNVSLNVAELVEVANQKPLFSSAKISAVCGNCLRLVA